ncbi:hypothetical protein [Arthrobacter sp. FW306-04-A]|uniref:hypothetical protein n=1 Tax=Arthrobacter sp. FW306-04-A TaxID=2879619 RepID=UPI0037C09234|nr:hypothetical protein LFT43_08965 [Arthrobacter sp. FW306-04-A]
MSTYSGGEGGRGILSTLGLILIPLLYCELTLLIVTGALGAIGSVLAARPALTRTLTAALRVRRRGGARGRPWFQGRADAGPG